MKSINNAYNTMNIEHRQIDCTNICLRLSLLLKVEAVAVAEDT